MRNFMLMTLLFGMILLSGCFNYEETLVLNKDGSGTVQMKCSVAKSYLEQMQKMYEQMAEAMPDMEIPENPGDAIFNREDIEEAVRADNSGLLLIRPGRLMNRALNIKPKTPRPTLNRFLPNRMTVPGYFSDRLKIKSPVITMVTIKSITVKNMVMMKSITMKNMVMSRITTKKIILSMKRT